ncbi:hypothetical protein [Paenibacillus oleatilyticus]|uniref:Uncharacterized protein n=1 Tax=Paenibacillus oleatilyticus TaxID=2594886 RepID=A0ABV4VCB6_9BACL
MEQREPSEVYYRGESVIKIVAPEPMDQEEINFRWEQVQERAWDTAESIIAAGEVV